jgi:hypothetical protein
VILTELVTNWSNFLKFEIAPPLLHIFNPSIPLNLKPVERYLFSNLEIDLFVTITVQKSLLPTLSKILEKAVASRLTTHLKEHGLLCQNQFGFQERTSRVHNLLKLTNYMTNELNKKHYVVGVFLDLRKAFDVVPHDILLLKLS